MPVMDDLQTDDLLRQLRSRDSREAWARFLEHYSPLLFDVARRFERDAEPVADCYLYICEQLSENGFRRLLRFRPDGPARFSTWLCAVARNLCLDWHRREFGRHRVFESVARMPALDQEIFRGLLVERLPIEDLFLKLAPRHPNLAIEQVAERAEAVGEALTSRQRWLLTVRGARGAPLAPGAAAHDGRNSSAFPARCRTRRHGRASRRSARRCCGRCRISRCQSASWSSCASRAT